MSTVNLQEILIVNGLGITLMIFLLLMRRRNVQKRYYIEKLYGTMIWLTIMGCAVETLSFLVDNRVFFGCIPLSYLLNSLCFLGTSCVGFLWCLYVELRIFNSLQKVWKSIKYLVIPFAVIVLICLVNLSGCGILFTISEENVYRRGTLVGLVYVVLFIYFLYSISLVDRSRKNGLYIHNFPTSYFVIPCMIGTLIQGAMYGIALGWTSVALALLFVYIQLQSLNALVDPLSGLYNRRYLDNVLDHLQHNEKHAVYGIMIDVNGFKKINDSFGHSAGDDAIRNIGQILSDSLPKCGIAIRYAGDEFILLLNTEEEAVAKDTIQKLHRNVERFNQLKKRKYQLSLSAGYERFDAKTGDTESFLLAMDKRMYAAKREYYERHEGLTDEE